VAHRGPTAGVTLHRFFVAATAISETQVLFPADQAHQIRRVLRLQQGDRVIALDGSGSELIVRLSCVADTVAGTVEERRANDAEPSAKVDLYLGLLKGAKIELVLQKCTEVGVSRFVPVSTSRAVPGEPGIARQRRFETIVREAAEQSRRGRLPAISGTVPYTSALQEASGHGRVLLLWEEEQSRHLRELQISSREPISLFVGPEGGFTAAEVDEALALGVQVATLGPRILRAETAAIVGAALVLSLLGDLG
jgi:16S rRNA (uracil1498-N3)-methyltransferase